MKKSVSASSECIYLVGLVVMCLGSAMMVKSDLGVETVIAPPYLLYLHFSRIFPILTFGSACFLYGCSLVLILMLLQPRFSAPMLLTVAASFFSSFLLDVWLFVLKAVPCVSLPARLAMMVAGTVICAIGIGLCLYGYFPPGPYELFPKGLCELFGWNIAAVKTGFDLASCLLGIALSFAFFGFGVFQGIHIGTALCALISGSIVGATQHFVRRHVAVYDRFPLRAFFENK